MLQKHCFACAIYSRTVIHYLFTQGWRYRLSHGNEAGVRCGRWTRQNSAETAESLQDAGACKAMGEREYSQHAVVFILHHVIHVMVIAVLYSIYTTLGYIPLMYFIITASNVSGRDVRDLYHSDIPTLYHGSHTNHRTVYKSLIHFLAMVLLVH